jgi:DNA topoisomerase-2
LDDDGTAIEPEYFVPILPLVLVNGAEGIGTGFSCRVPTYHPRDLMNNLEHLMNGETMEEMKPWVRGYKGNLEMVGGKWVSSGVSKVISANQLEITELPVGRWTEDYKEQLEDWILNKKDFGVVDYESHYTEAEVRFVVKFQSGVLSDWGSNGKVNTMMKLTESKRFGTTNMHLFNPDNQIRRYRTPLDIIRAFYDVRRDFYVKRKAYQLERLRREIEFLGYRVRFIREVVNGDLEVSRRSIDDIEGELREKGYPKARRQNGLWYLMESDTEETSVDDEETGGSYEYLLGMPLRSLTKEKMSGLENEKAMKEGERLELEKKEVNDIWRNELREFVEGFEKQIDDWIGEVMGKTAVGSKRVSAKKVVKKTPVKKTVRQKAQVADSDEE